MSGAVDVRAEARNVLDWYRERLAETTHALAFAESALLEAQAREREHAVEFGKLHEELGAVVKQIAARPAAPLDDPEFGAWVAQHWDAIQDARLAYALEHPEQPAVLEQP